MMIRQLLISATLFGSYAMAVEGYQDHFLDREQTIYIHNILCGDLNNLATLKPAFVYSNSQNIAEGTYYFSTKYGNYSYTIKPIEGQPEQLQLRGLLTAGQTQKEQMKIDYCIVKPLDAAPAALNSKITQVTLAPDDSNWATTMEQYALVAGRPAFAPEQYEDPRASAEFADYDQAFYQNNQTILTDLEAKFESQAEQYRKTLPDQFRQAWAYAKQEDGATTGKHYPPIEEPAVWTPTSKERYNDQVRMQQQERAFDELIQQTFDWLFAQVGKDSDLVSSDITSIEPAEWTDAQRHQKLILANKFDNGKVLQLTFYINSERVNIELFESLDDIKAKSNNKRQSLDIQRNQPREKLSAYNSFDVYSPVEKVNLFFSPFRADETRVKVK